MSRRTIVRLDIRWTKALKLEPYLSSLGLRAVISRVTASDSAGNPLPDRRIFAYTEPDNGHVKILMYGVPTAWWRAGLRTGDDILTVNGEVIKSAGQFRALLARKNPGDDLVVIYLRGGQTHQTTVHLASYEQVKVELYDVPNPTPRQREMMRLWIAGNL